jgi:hypothetical protein
VRTVVVVGIGEMGGVFARALLRTGAAVVPVLRGDDPQHLAAEIDRPALVLVTVAEDDLDVTLGSLPASWLGSIGLIQNELLPHVWERQGIVDPTVAAVWFEKKPGQDVRVIIPTPVAGPAAPMVVEGLRAIGIPADEVQPPALVDALVVKNLYILVANIAGLAVGGTVGALVSDHAELTAAVTGDVLDLQEHLLGRPLDRDRLVAQMAAAMSADPEHKATGRTAWRRLQRAIVTADAARLEVPTLRSIAASTAQGGS